MEVCFSTPHTPPCSSTRSCASRDTTQFHEIGWTCLEAAGLPVPPTIVCQDAEAALQAFEQLGGGVIVKPLFGSEGRGMVRVSDPEPAWRTFRTLERTRNVLYLQQMIHHPGWDLRVFVLGGRVLATMRRHARDGWRTNIAQGGRAEPVPAGGRSDRGGPIRRAAAGRVGAGRAFRGVNPSVVFGGLGKISFFD